MRLRKEPIIPKFVASRGVVSFSMTDSSNWGRCNESATDCTVKFIPYTSRGPTGLSGETVATGCFENRASKYCNNSDNNKEDQRSGDIEWHDNESLGIEDLIQRHGPRRTKYTTGLTVNDM